MNTLSILKSAITQEEMNAHDSSSPPTHIYSKEFIRVADLFAEAVCALPLVPDINDMFALTQKIFEHVPKSELSKSSAIAEFRSELAQELFVEVDAILHEQNDIRTLSRLVPELRVKVKTTEFNLEIGLPDLFSLVPVLFRQCATLCNAYVAEVTCLCERLSDDRERMQLIGAPILIGDLVKISGPLSDRHSKPGRVRRLTFSTGWTVIYKPRPLHGEEMWSAVCRWMNSGLGDRFIEAPQCLSREKYGWMQEVVYREALSGDEVEHYFFSAGCIIALAQILNSSDLHFENIVSCGNNPVVVDSETIWQPQLNITKGEYPQVGWMIDHLKWSCLVAAEMPEVGGQSRLVGAFDISAASLLKPNIRSKSLCSFNSIPQDISYFLPTVLSGYRKVSKYIQENGVEFLSLLERNCRENNDSRVVLLSTRGYEAIRSRAQSRKFYTSGILWGGALSYGYEYLAATFGCDVARSVTRSQVLDLAVGAIPRFQMNWCSTNLCNDKNQQVAQLNGMSAFQNTKYVVKCLNETDIEMICCNFKLALELITNYKQVPYTPKAA